MASNVDETDQIDFDIINVCGTSLFDEIEKKIKTTIPSTLRKILLLNEVDSVCVLARVDEAYKLRLENFVRNDLIPEMIETPETLKDYLGIYHRCQDRFKFSTGQEIVLNMMVRLCKQLSPNNDDTVALDGSHAEVNPDISSKSSNESESFLDFGERFVQIANEDEKDLFHHIGSLMIHVYNDAKRTTLSGWSWPSRVVTAELGRNFKLGSTSTPNFDLRYVTPTSHAELLSCIVETDTDHLAETLTESLAVSARCDASVDRTQKHNLFVMVQVVTKDPTVKTFCLGFDIPKGNGASGYVDCLRSISKTYLPWDAFFALISSVVTDGENLNLGRLNGLVSQLKRLRNLSPSSSPLISIWCVPHRTNLAWKSVSSINIIAKLIGRAKKLSKHFRRSGKRTQNLHSIAAENGFDKPLRYPAFFAVRWVEYVYKLFNVILRNWRTSMKYFESENLDGHLDFWTRYNTIHFVTFLTDVLGLVKTFQKGCQSDDITLIDVDRRKERLFERLQRCKNTSVEEGWEKLFLEKVRTHRNIVSLHDIHLKTTINRSRNALAPFTPAIRVFIIDKLVGHLKIRLSLDADLLKSFKPLLSMSLATSEEDLKTTHAVIVPDVDQEIFISEYYEAAALLIDEPPRTVLDTLKKLISINPGHLQSIQTSLARILAAKPHSADVERLISECG